MSTLSTMKRKIKNKNLTTNQAYPSAHMWFSVCKNMVCIKFSRTDTHTQTHIQSGTDDVYSETTKRRLMRSRHVWRASYAGYSWPRSARLPLSLSLSLPLYSFAIIAEDRASRSVWVKLFTVTAVCSFASLRHSSAASFQLLDIDNAQSTTKDVMKANNESPGY